MARRNNILRLLKAEIEKGNTYIDPYGFFCNGDKLEQTINDNYIKGLKDKTLPMDTVWQEYYSEHLARYVKADVLLQEIRNTGLGGD